MDKIDLNAIAMKLIIARPHHTKLMIARSVAREVVHEALVLASEKVKPAFRELRNTEKGWPGKVWSGIDKQSILDVEKLIV